jgi:hypothetical protein
MCGKRKFQYVFGLQMKTLKKFTETDFSKLNTNKIIYFILKWIVDFIQDLHAFFEWLIDRFELNIYFGSVA